MDPLLPTAWLALLLGAFFTARSVPFVISPDRLDAILDAYATHPGTGYVAGQVSFFMGLLLLVTHHEVDSLLAVVVTLLGGVSVLEGLLLLAAPTAYRWAMGGGAGGGRARALVVLSFGVALLITGAGTLLIPAG